MKNKSNITLSRKAFVLPPKDNPIKDKVISVRLDPSIIDQIDTLATDSGYSRNELIKLLLVHSLQTVVLQE